jgi:Icc-related predicted phosphoesterase
MTHTTRLFFATDIHASNKCFKKFLNAAKHYEADVLVLGGDVTGKAFVPIVMKAVGSGTAFDNGKEVRLETQADISRFEERCPMQGLTSLGAIQTNMIACCPT